MNYIKMDGLFYDIYLEIFSHLTEIEYLPLRLVCKEWNNTIISIDDKKEILDLIYQDRFLQALLVTKHKQYKKHNRPIKLFRHISILPHFGLTKFLINHCGTINLRIRDSIDKNIDILTFTPENKNRINCLILLLNEWVKLGNEINKKINLEFCCKINSFELAVFARKRNNNFIRDTADIKNNLNIALEKENKNLVLFITRLETYQLTVDEYFQISLKYLDIADELLKKCSIYNRIKIEAENRINTLQKKEILTEDEIKLLDICQKTIQRIDSFDEFKKIIANNVLNKLIDEKFRVNLNDIKMQDIIQIDWEKPWGFNYVIQNGHIVEIIVSRIFNTDLDSNNEKNVNNVNNGCCLQ